ncbi:hypothetical protein AVEN_109211-1 [Araneus ventricosus]|uniref:Uncharacterized protein n=1 Tax=Araneus ventricosus TaxID=182803 RepID=A0A4Y2RL11_ARAVE|nr:hypothetical protein AVEN_109211-1 [Araneus ventricosus]
MCGNKLMYNEQRFYTLLTNSTGSDGRRCNITASGLEHSRFETRLHQRSVLNVGLVFVKSDVVDQASSLWCGAEVWRGRCQFRHSHHLTAVQCNKVLHKIALVLLQNRTLVQVISGSTCQTDKPALCGAGVSVNTVFLNL